jgi:hypothetical protein
MASGWFVTEIAKSFDEGISKLQWIKDPEASEPLREGQVRVKVKQREHTVTELCVVTFFRLLQHR